MRILGIDPGSRITGFGIIEIAARATVNRPRFVTCGCIRLANETPMPQRLSEIFSGVTELIQQYQPTILAIEQVFLAHNVASALKLGQARGAILVAGVQQGLTVFEYAPNQIKQAVTGQGHADKQQVQYMVKLLLQLSDVPQADAADALAVALCHAQHQGSAYLTRGR